jgi:hypothetical protein
MSDVSDADFLLSARGRSQELGAWVVGLAFTKDGRCGFGLGDGTLRIASPGGDWLTAEAHDGAVLSLVADARDGFLTGGDDGRLVRTGADGSIGEIAALGTMKWVEHVAAHESGLRAASVGKQLHLFDGRGEKLKVLTHPSSVGGIAFDAKGKRVAASHYNGASLWFVAAKEDKPRVLEWKGDAGERPAWLAPGRWPAHAHVRLPVEDAFAELHRARPVAGDERRRQRRHLALLRRRPDGQGADRTGGRRRRAVQRRRLPSAA